MTSAPKSARTVVDTGPAMKLAASMTLRPARSGSAMGLGRALLDSRALDGQELLDADHAEHLLLERRPVRLRRGLRAEALRQLRVGGLPGRERGEERRGRIGDDRVAERAQVLERHAEPGEPAAAGQVHER